MAIKARYRIEKDTMGEVKVPASALYGAQTQRAVENFPVSGLREHPALIRAFILIKKAAALSNHELGELDRKLATAISDAADEVLGDGAFGFAKLLAAGRKAPKKGTRGRSDLRDAADLVPADYV
ncbi:MAG TPA: lyase family protein, partial [Thermoanaerobaculia bacterium]